MFSLFTEVGRNDVEVLEGIDDVLMTSTSFAMATDFVACRVKVAQFRAKILCLCYPRAR